MFHKTSVKFCIFYVLLFFFPSLGKVWQFENLMSDEGSVLTRNTTFEKLTHLVPENGFARSETQNAVFTLEKQYVDNDEDNGGPSSDFRPLGYNWAMEYLEYIEKGDIGGECVRRKRSVGGNKVTAEQLCEKEKEFFARLPDVMRKFEKDILGTLEKAQLNGIVTGNVYYWYRYWS
jgi:hypothetical protein